MRGGKAETRLSYRNALPPSRGQDSNVRSENPPSYFAIPRSRDPYRAGIPTRKYTAARIDVKSRSAIPNAIPGAPVDKSSAIQRKDILKAPAATKSTDAQTEEDAMGITENKKHIHAQNDLTPTNAGARRRTTIFGTFRCEITFSFSKN